MHLRSISLFQEEIKRQNILYILLMFPMYFSAGLIPSYLLYKDFTYAGYHVGMILPLIYSPYNILIMKTNLQASIPDSLEESAFWMAQRTFRFSGKSYFRYQSLSLQHCHCSMQ